MIGESADDCAFCKIITGDAPAQDLHHYVQRKVVRFQPLNPVAPGHRLFVPVPHSQTSYYIKDALILAHDYGRGLTDAFNVIMNVGEAATQSMWHPHVHVVPRQNGDGLHLPWTGQT